MKLSNGQKQSITALVKILSLETLIKIKNGQIPHLEDLQFSLFNPSSLQERSEIHTMLDKEIKDRKKKLHKVIQ